MPCLSPNAKSCRAAPVRQPAGLASGGGGVHYRPVTRKSPLEDATHAGFAWARFKRLMRFMVAVTAATVVISLGILYAYNGFVSVHFYIAAGLGIGLAMLLMSALMGLVFLSSGTGHDETVDDRLSDSDGWKDRDR